MDDGEVDFSHQEMFDLGELPSNCSMDSFFNDLLVGDAQTCTHTHTCNPPGPDYSHTHTCFHVHTKVVSAPSDDKTGTDDTAESAEKAKNKRPLGNKEAVRKYREKKKARAASLEDEVLKLRTMNQQLLKRLQGQAALEAEVARLKCLLVDIRGRIEGEIGSFPYQKSANGVNLANQTMNAAYMMNPCNMQCNDQVYCMQPGMNGKGWEGMGFSGRGLNDCEFDNLQCLANQNSGVKELSDCAPENVPNSNCNSSCTSKRKGRAARGS